MQSLQTWFDCIADAVSNAIESIWGFSGACVAVIAWAIAGPVFHYSESWQLVINTGTTSATFLMLFLLQRSQNRGTASLHRKIDELVKAVPEADESVIDPSDE